MGGGGDRERQVHRRTVVNGSAENLLRFNVRSKKEVVLMTHLLDAN